MIRISAPSLMAASLLALAGLAPAAWAQAPAWPDKPVRFIVPYSPGGTTDYAARQVAQRLGEQTGKSFIVENKAGASGLLGTQEVVRSTPDGSTFLVNDTTYAMLPSLFAKLPWDHKSDLIPVTTLVQTPVVLIVPAASPFKTAQELMAYARANPGKLNFGSGGPGSSTHLSAEVFKAEGKLFITHIPYRGAGAALADVMSGQIDLLITAAPTAVPPVKGGRVRALAVSGTQRVPALPGVPTFAEAGLPGYQVVNWFGLAAPKGTPRAIVERLHAEVQKALAEPRLREALAAQGAAPGGLAPAAFESFVQQEVALWSAVAKRANVKPE